MPRMLLAVSICIIMLTTAYAKNGTQTDSAVVLRDLTESGTVLAFDQPAPGVVSVDILEDPFVDYPAFDITGCPGQKVTVLFPSLEEGWTAHMWVGPGQWQKVDTTITRAGLGMTLTLDSGRELIELHPPGYEKPRVSSYSYFQFLEYIGSLPAGPRLTKSVIGESVQGRPIYKVVFEEDDPVLQADQKPTVILLIRQHGDEWPSSLILEGMLDYLLGLNGWEPTDRDTKQVRWVFYPLINPDGAVADERYNAQGIDLNRDWSGTGPNASQEPETYQIQIDMANLPYPDTFRVCGDHHGWWLTGDGGYRFDNGGYPANVTDHVYRESKKDTEHITEYAPYINYWSENGGQTGMARVALYHWKNWITHTVEYDRDERSAEGLRTEGANIIRAMTDTVYALNVEADRVEFKKTVPLKVDEDDQNRNALLVESVSIQVWDELTGDTETVQFNETGVNTGLFIPASPLFTIGGPAIPGDGMLQTRPGSMIWGYYVDMNLSSDHCYAAVPVGFPEMKPRTVQEVELP